VLGFCHEEERGFGFAERTLPSCRKRSNPDRPGRAALNGRIVRQRASTEADRQRAKELRAVIQSTRTSKRAREQARLELDALEPPVNPEDRFIPSVPESGEPVAPPASVPETYRWQRVDAPTKPLADPDADRDVDTMDLGNARWHLNFDVTVALQKSMSSPTAARIARLTWRVATLEQKTSLPFPEWLGQQDEKKRSEREAWQARVAAASPQDREKMKADELFYRFGLDK
jgi:hypothetical protein